MSLNLLKKKQNQKQPEQSPEKLPQKPQNKSPNLLQSVLRVYPEEKRQFKISKYAIGLIILIQVLFIALSLWNSATIAKIEELQRTTNRLERAVLSKAPQERAVRDVIARTEKLKGLEKSRLSVYPRVSAFVNGMPNNVTLLKSFIEENKMTLTVETDTPIVVSLLISRYFEKGFASEIVILSANLNNSTGKFVATLEVVF